MSKDLELKQRLIKNGIFLGILLGALSGGGVALSMYSDSVQEENQQKQTEVGSMRSAYAAFKEELGSGLSVSRYYDAYVIYHNDSYQLNREALPGWLSILREKHYLTDMQVTMSPMADVSGAAFALKSGVLAKSDVKLTFGALSDNAVYNFIESLERQLPGIVLVDYVKITHIGDVTRNILVDLGQQHKITPLVTAELHFSWLGIRPKADNTQEGAENGNPGK